MRTGLVLLLVLMLSGCGVAVELGSESGAGELRCTTEVRGDAGDDVRAAVETVQAYWDDEFATAGGSFDPVRRICGYRAGNGASCAGQELVPNNASYCAAEDLISFDVAWMTAAYEQIGDAFIYHLIGHEYAHAVQGPLRLGIEHRFTIEHELQADCMAGAYMGDSIRAGRLQLEPGDTDELLSGLAAVADPEGSPWFAPGAHGTVEQRTARFAAGFRGSLTTCDL